MRYLFFCLIIAGLNFVVGEYALAQSSKAPIRIGIIGDDFINGAGLFKPEDTFASQLQAKISRKAVIKDYSHEGATTASTYSRIDSIANEQPEIAIVAVGLNDALAGVNPDVIYSNLDNILRELERRRIYILFISMQAPPHVSQSYAMQFNAVYPKLDGQHNVLMLDQFYAPLFNEPKYLQMDRMHPNKFGVQILVNKIDSVLHVMLKNLVEAQRCYKNGTANNCQFKKLR